MSEFTKKIQALHAEAMQFAAAAPIAGIGKMRQWSKDDVAFVKSAVTDPKHPAHEHAKMSLRSMLVADRARSAGNMDEARRYARRGLAHVIVAKKKHGETFSAEPAGEFAVRRIPSAHSHAVMLTDAGSSMRNATIGGGSIVKSFPSEQEAKSHAAALQHTEDKKPVSRDGKYRVVALDDPKATPQGRSHREIHQLKASNPHFGGGMFAAAKPDSFTPRVLGGGMDPNGNHVVKVGHKGGSFTIQTNGNIPTAHKNKGMLKGMSPETHQKIMQEVHAYVSAHGTPIAKNIIGIKAK